MKQSLLVFLPFLTLTCNLLAQNTNQIKLGGYLSVNDFNNNTPTFDSCFSITKRSHGAILAWGGNDYSVSYKNESVTDKMIRNDIWGIFQHDTLYLNGHLLVGFKYYVKVEVLGKYMFLLPVLPTQPKYRKKFGIKYDPYTGFTIDGRSTGGSPGGAIGGAMQGAQLAGTKIPVIMERETGDVYLATREKIMELLEFSQTLKDEFKNEKNINNELIIKYITLINKN